MKKFFATAAVMLAASVATPALAGTGSAFSTAERCSAALASGNYQGYVPGMVQTSKRELLNNMRTAGLSGPTCIEEKVRVSEIDATRTSDSRTVWAYVIVPGEVIMVDSATGQYMDIRCGNHARNPVKPQIAACTDCNRPQPVAAYAPQPAPPVAARPQVQVGLIGAPASTPVSYRQQRSPIQISMIPVGGMPSAGSVYVGGSSHMSYNYTMPSTPVPPFGGTTMPPAGNGFGGVTQPPAGNGFGGNTQPPAPVPGPQPVSPPFFGGATASPLPAPVFNGGGFYNGNGSGSQGGLPAPVYNDGNGSGSYNNGSFSGNTNTFTGSTGVIQGPVSNGVVTTTTVTIGNGGLPTPVFGGSTNNNGNGNFGGNTNGQ